MKDKFKEAMGYVVSVLKDAGYEPYDQLYAYASTGNESYITRKGDARKLIAQLDREKIWNYIEPHIKQRVQKTLPHHHLHGGSFPP